jgi:pilus assembly protein Flp/PilA
MDLHRTLTAAVLRWHRTGRRDERAASLVEYALLIALIAVVMVGAVTLLGDTAGSSIDGSSSSILDATTG